MNIHTPSAVIKQNSNVIVRVRFAELRIPADLVVDSEPQRMKDVNINISVKFAQPKLDDKGEAYPTINLNEDSLEPNINIALDLPEEQHITGASVTPTRIVHLDKDDDDTIPFPAALIPNSDRSNRTLQYNRHSFKSDNFRKKTAPSSTKVIRGYNGRWIKVPINDSQGLSPVESPDTSPERMDMDYVSREGSSTPVSEPETELLSQKPNKEKGKMVHSEPLGSPYVESTSTMRSLSTNSNIPANREDGYRHDGSVLFQKPAVKQPEGSIANTISHQDDPSILERNRRSSTSHYTKSKVDKEPHLERAEEMRLGAAGNAGDTQLGQEVEGADESQVIERPHRVLRKRNKSSLTQLEQESDEDDETTHNFQENSRKVSKNRNGGNSKSSPPTGGTPAFERITLKLPARPKNGQPSEPIRIIKTAVSPPKRTEARQQRWYSAPRRHSLKDDSEKEQQGEVHSISLDNSPLKEQKSEQEPSTPKVTYEPEINDIAKQLEKPDQSQSQPPQEKPTSQPLSRISSTPVPQRESERLSKRYKKEHDSKDSDQSGQVILQFKNIIAESNDNNQPKRKPQERRTERQQAEDSRNLLNEAKELKLIFDTPTPKTPLEDIGKLQPRPEPTSKAVNGYDLGIYGRKNIIPPRYDDVPSNDFADQLKRRVNDIKLFSKGFIKQAVDNPVIAQDTLIFEDGISLQGLFMNTMIIPVFRAFCGDDVTFESLHHRRLLVVITDNCMVLLDYYNFSGYESAKCFRAIPFYLITDVMVHENPQDLPFIAFKLDHRDPFVLNFFEGKAEYNPEDDYIYLFLDNRNERFHHIPFNYWLDKLKYTMDIKKKPIHQLPLIETVGYYGKFQEGKLKQAIFRIKTEEINRMYLGAKYKPIDGRKPKGEKHVVLSKTPKRRYKNNDHYVSIYSENSLHPNKKQLRSSTGSIPPSFLPAQMHEHLPENRRSTINLTDSHDLNIPSSTSKEVIEVSDSNSESHVDEPMNDDQIN
ncbi:hypothetical protein E3Q13_01163 [Wallemia mellicola]|nr:hypothetical protein E3Q13_01163 [Wallemia mellicola]